MHYYQGHFIRTRNSLHIIIRALAYYSTRRIIKLILLLRLTIYVRLFLINANTRTINVSNMSDTPDYDPNTFLYSFL